MTDQASSPKVPTTIVTGFLGSGKTTIISHLIDELKARGEQVVYIKNEIGDQDIDGQLMKSKQVVARELLNGCICCTLVGPFVAAITEVVQTFAPDRIVIEASGTAEPAALALMVSGHPLLQRDAMISIIDVVNFEGYEDLTMTAQQQTQFTDLIIFNKVELVDQARKEAVVGYVRELNTHSPIIEAHQGKIPVELIFGTSSKELEEILSQKPEHHEHHHLDEDALEGFSLRLTRPISQEKLSRWLETFPPRIFRVKGFLTSADGQQFLVNRVGRRTTIEPTKVQRQTEAIVLLLIGYQATQLQEQLDQELQKLAD
jgi:G3E family GTPase